jgi:2,3-bisphosphoglycerate-independent phosphoglycerate mutase
VGHLTIGAGKVLYQHYPRITIAIKDGNFFESSALKNAFAHARKNSSAVNLVGLLSKGNVHAAIEHVQALLKMAAQENVERVKLHLFADGKDSPPHSVEEILKELPWGKIATLSGRFYAMDRDENWQLTKRTYEALTAPNYPITAEFEAALQNAYAREGSEEFLPPLRLRPDGAIAENDAVIFFNYREDSIRQIAEPFTATDFNKFPRVRVPNLYVTTMTQYKKEFAVPVAFLPETIEMPLGYVVSAAGRTQLRLAETYKYAHVTYFFNGLREPAYKNEFRALIPSLQTPHPEKQPKLRASAITDRLVSALNDQAFDFILVNYANPDTIGHTGDFEAGVATAKVIDEELARIVKAIEGQDTVVAITADHGNLEEMRDAFTGRTESQHDPNPVPFHLVGREFKGRKFINSERLTLETNGVLSDVAPTILELMQLPKPEEMSGRNLLQDLI